MRRHAILLTLVLVAPVNLKGVLAQDNIVDSDCNVLMTCVQPRDCSSITLPLEEEDCRRCLIKNPFSGGCAQRGNDPICEARKAALRVDRDVRLATLRIECESQRTASGLACKQRVAQAVAECTVRKAAPSGADVNVFQKLLAAGGSGEKFPLPEAFVEKLLKADIYKSDFLQQISISRLGQQDVVPDVYKDEEIGFTVGNRIFLKDGRRLDDIPPRFWVKQVEFAKLFAEYGVLEVGRILGSERMGLFELVHSKVEKICATISC